MGTDSFDSFEELTRRVADLEAEVRSLRFNVHGEQQLWPTVRDHAQRFDTLQTWWWKRVWFWLQGWPWHDLNGTRDRGRLRLLVTASAVAMLVAG